MSTTLQTLRKPCRQNKPKSATGLKPLARSSIYPKTKLQKPGDSAPAPFSNGNKEGKSPKASTSKKSSRSSGKPGSSFTISPSEKIREILAALSYISGKPVEFIICDYLRGIDDRLESPASLFEDSLSFCNSKKEEWAALARFREYRDTHGLNFPDKIIEINLAENEGRITHDEARELRKAFRVAEAMKEVA